MRYRWTGRGQEYSEVPPVQCPDGHRLGAGRMLVGVAWTGQGRRRAWTCTQCGQVLVDDGTVTWSER